MKINPNLVKTGLNGFYIKAFKMLLNENIIKQYKGIKLICMQGSSDRAKVLAQKLADEFFNINPSNFMPVNLSNNEDFHCYRVGSVLCASHGMGNPSIITFLDAISKIMYFAGNLDIEYVRIGTSGGFGVNPGSVILTQTAYMPDLIPEFKLYPLGKKFVYPTHMNSELNQKILHSQPKNLDFLFSTGNTIAADDFYRGQVRLDGIVKPRFSLEERSNYFSKMKQLNILNFEMESTGLASFCNRAQIPATMIATTIVDRIKVDSISATPAELIKFSDNAQSIIINYIKEYKILD
jgi:uridine phosphorylase